MTDEVDLFIFLPETDGKGENAPVGMNVSAVTSLEPWRLPCRQQTAGWWQTWPADKNKHKLQCA